ncbi:hypothetical protein [Spiroplasma taiwanense]|uniref:Uncharacterized protein n=1 Tax=Spiroplasma taiwanense CT-1 TaxID=1276220 RepID=S5LX38_9MOLU|nr:hypothetical protein [Spiroplasma taiwanense]AGR41191.1 hypothetical protein STAIW_v1c05690 [Spiroplasma taiwanense CT-1]
MIIDNKLLTTKYFDEALKNLIEILKILSIQSKPLPGAIFGLKTIEV